MVNGKENFIKGLLLDVDGVIMDSEPFIRQAYINFYKNKYGVNLTNEDFADYVGTGELNSIIGIGNKFKLTYDAEEDKTEIYNTYAEIIKGKLTLMPGVRRFIDNAKKAGLRIALATSADRIKLTYSFGETNLDLSLFDFIVCGDMVNKAKPDGSIYRYAALGLRLENEQCLVVEDALSGHKAAKNAHSESLGISGSFDDFSQMLSGADAVIRDLSVFPDFSDLNEFNSLYRTFTSEFRTKGVLGKLFSTAKEVIKNSYAPYSNFNVGAALLTDDGNIYKGCNVENASFGGTICAERAAALSAISEQGRIKVKVLVVSSYSDEPAPPCAICRQFFTEFADSDMQVYLVSLKSGVVRHYNFGTVMPLVFELR